ncbi:MAG TPA: hypothetical protein DCQ26_01125 [Marinilabiliales bacterium]|nr:MAG: hypothetical protein A2W95_11090 [Bacteroidetes bacterium GWA2_40_14]OFX59724.1 MAG: hypothetical protein A2W84_01755 [Bacteroidetes bacterium GWC2_40_13]OFX70895.1 MAG: hypothetical protein A2W96_14075 [Bacteroidetes bacterium GWD2_40_43]OFX95695.1 MAG: hypothetical protein A2W97_06815 [Bacteroidetes bacterium GWE2_40_63]OFY21230.1 MAG: hypothetical protein A2W88_19375 [Bacteroidetes bacterium GWF2_40_13]OFZ23507.1 MAG: hypothetical protein A2437_05630 [Bacteroidetes bacterium RIFOXYC
MKINKLVLGCLFTLAFLHSFSQLDNLPLVTVTGEGIVSQKPDVVLIGIVFTKELESQVDRLNQLTRIFEPTDTKIRIFGLNGQENEEGRIRVQWGKTLVYSKEVFIELTDISRLDQILLEIRKQKLQLSFVEYRVSNQSQLCSEARKKAVETARKKATELAQQLGQSIGKAHDIEDLGTENINWYNLQKEDIDRINRMSPEEYLVIPSEQVICSKVKVSFDLIKN